MARNFLHQITLGISRCLLGDLVRYDGAGKYSVVCCNRLSKHFQLLPICPEVEAGLAIPRPPVELVENAGELRVIGRDNKTIDVTQALTTFSQDKVASLDHLSGFVLTPSSPSCGLHSVSIRSRDGHILSENNSGLFAKALVEHFPLLPVIEEPKLVDVYQYELFKLKVMMYDYIQHNRQFIAQSNSGLIDLLPKMNHETTKESKIIFVNRWLDTMGYDELVKILNLITS
ncbi:MAG: hypothetical protein COB22_00780 [Cycloclasticus sp.]|nr:MAG: hypothetical protein COB22_00780 [Cycloclasticus sp.]